VAIGAPAPGWELAGWLVLAGSRRRGVA